MAKVLFTEGDCKAILIENKEGLRVTLTNFGASILSIEMKDINGVYDEITLTTDTIEEFKKNGAFWGATVGRVANRIKRGQFKLNGKEYQITCNDGKNSLHGGIEGFHLRTWDTEIDGDTVIFKLVSPDGDQGYPGTLTVVTKYYFDEEGRLVQEYHAESDADTICCITNHTYFNVAGHDKGNILNQILQIEGDYMLETDEEGITTGQIIKPVPEYDFSKAKPVGQDIKADIPSLKRNNGYDALYALRERGFKKGATIYDPVSHRGMEVYTDYPCMCLYSGGGLKDNKGKNGAVYQEFDAIVLEPKFFPNAINYAHFGDDIILKKGECFCHKNAYKFFVK